jgi:tetratricopeptide (TPR) repeat protein
MKLSFHRMIVALAGAALLACALPGGTARCAQDSGDNAVRQAVRRGDGFMREGRFAEAIPEYEKVLARDASNAVIYYNLGIAHHMEGRPEKAAELYREALAISPKEPNYRENLALALADAGKPVEAIQEFREVLRADPGNKTALLKLAYLYDTQGNPERAVSTYEKALEADPDYADAHYWLAKTLLAQGKKDEARGHARRALELGYLEPEPEFLRRLALEPPRVTTPIFQPAVLGEPTIAVDAVFGDPSTDSPPAQTPQ